MVQAERLKSNLEQAQTLVKKLADGAKDAKAALAKTRAELGPALKEADAAEALVLPRIPCICTAFHIGFVPNGLVGRQGSVVEWCGGGVRGEGGV